MLLLSAGAGLAEEAFFRGVVQADLGWIPASLLFGLLHTGHREMIPFGLWAAVMGFFLGALYLFTDNLLAPMIAHGLYDFGALGYVRYGVRDEEIRQSGN
jgi:membrane protease YdiL (CAAX protease family)